MPSQQSMGGPSTPVGAPTPGPPPPPSGAMSQQNLNQIVGFVDYLCFVLYSLMDIWYFSMLS